MTPQEVEQYVLLASDASNPQHQQHANALLHHWTTTTSESTLADSLIQVLQSTQREVVLFYSLTTFLNLRQGVTSQQRAALREQVFLQILHNSHNNGSCWSPNYLRTKVGVLLAQFIRMDFPQAWPNAFDVLQNSELITRAPDILLRTLVALTEDFGKDETAINTRIKNYLRGYTNTNGSSQSPENPQDSPQQPTVPPQQSISGQLLTTILSLLADSLTATHNHNGNGNGDAQATLQIAVLALTALKGFMGWLDLSLLLEERVLKWLHEAVRLASLEDSLATDAGVLAIECFQELIGRGIQGDNQKKMAMMQHTRILETIHNHVDLKNVDASPIDVVLEVAKFLNRTGLELLPILMSTSDSSALVVKTQLLDLFFRCFAYDDIDVSQAVIPLAGSIASEQQQNETNPLISQLLTITYQQMRYQEDFQFDWDDEDEAEEEQYRTELRKLNQKLIRVAPQTCLQFCGQMLSQLPSKLSTAPTRDIEAALRLVYHYCEGIRPPPGMKVVMRNEQFRNLLVALHTSDITFHSHREVLTLYYETAVRYHPLLKEKPELLQTLLGSLTDTRGLQHSHPRVRSRSCYLLLRLVKSVGTSSCSGKSKANNSCVLRPYVETAVSGIQSLLQNNSVELRLEDTLNLFETIGLLLGMTGLEPSEQQQYLTQVMTPHVRSIERVLEQQKQQQLHDEAYYGEVLSGSIAAIAFLSKGFKKPSVEVQMVLLETLNIALAVLEALPNNDLVRNKSFVLLQRLIQCLEEKVLPSIPRLLYLLIAHCTTEDVLDVAQLFNQLCIKFKDNAIPALDAALLPFLQKCHALIVALDFPSAAPPTSSEENDDDVMVAPHERTEKLSIQKLTFTVLQHVVGHSASAMLFSSTNISSLENILQSMSEGAIHVEDPLMKKTCLVFFRKLLDQWAAVSTAGVSSTSENNGNPQQDAPPPPPPLVVAQGFVRFICDILIPGVIQSFCQNDFNLKDANQWRSVSEFAGLLEILQERVADVYYSQVVMGTLAGLPPALLEGFQISSNRKDLETALKNLVANEKKHTT